MPSSKPGKFQRLPKALPLLLLSIFVSAPVFADPAMDWVQKMSNAMRNLSYRGNFVYAHENQLESMQISHLQDDSGVKERLISLNGEAREVLRDNQNLTCIWPTSKKVVVDVASQNSFSPIFIPEDIVKLEQFYEIKLLVPDRIANVTTQVVHIKPRDEFRYGMKFWINEQNGLMMKSSLLDEMNHEVEQVMFTSMKVFDGDEKLEFDIMPPIDESYTLMRYHYGDVANPETSTSSITASAWQLTDAPGGFWQKSMLKRKVPDSDRFVQQMVYTDGLASLSVFIEMETSDTHLGGTSMGAVNAFIRVTNNHTVTAIGEVPAATVKKMAESVSYQQ
jgi:sigma-E factor negative regulatory protein RseB